MTRQQSAAALAPAAALPNRWIIALAGVAVQMILGTVYAWSVFKTPLTGIAGWTQARVFGFDLAQQITFTFSLTIFFLGSSAAIGGRFVDRAGARNIAMTAAVLFGAGTLLAGLAVGLKNIWLLWLGYGVIGGIGNGLGYVTPVAVLLRWFPDKKGIITGMAVMGFGLGAAAMGKLAPWMISRWGIANTFYACGAVFLLVILLAAQKLRNPPADFVVAAKGAKSAAPAGRSLSLGEALRTYQFYILFSLLLLNVVAGIAIISNLSPMAEELLRLARFGKREATILSRQTDILLVAGTIVFATQVFNGVGRMFWGSLSEKLGRKWVFVLLFATQVPLFILLPRVTSVWMFSIMACWILLCYGGGFGTMPSFAADTFGPRCIGAIYGVILFAWGIAGGVGPTLMEAVKSATKSAANPNGSFDVALYIAAGLLAVGLVLALLYRKPKLSPE